ncbi:MAG: amidohydrolase family protein, partial [Proteobacteria bacterium]|nr:amidohydrolase family protein [Pseudomonadota bacterium]
LARLALQGQANLASAMVTLLFSDFCDLYPNVTIQVANLGGTLPMVVERMDHAAKLRTPDDPVPSSRIGGVYVDCASLGPRAIDAAVAVYGADRVMLGTDCPIFRTDWTLDAVRETRLGAEEQEMILSRNAQALLDRITNGVAA